MRWRRFLTRNHWELGRLVPPRVRLILPIIVLVAFVVPAVAAGVSSPAVAPADGLELAVLDELNAVRLEHGRRPFRLNPRLVAAADAHSLEMVSSGYFGHESSDGTNLATRIKRFYRPLVGPRTWSVGENLLWRAPGVSARTAVADWLKSPGHRENLLRRSFREVGISAVRAKGAPGVYGQRTVIILTVDFGTR